MSGTQNWSIPCRSVHRNSSRKTCWPHSIELQISTQLPRWCYGVPRQSVPIKSVTTTNATCHVLSLTSKTHSGIGMVVWGVKFYNLLPFESLPDPGKLECESSIPNVSMPQPRTIVVAAADRSLDSTSVRYSRCLTPIPGAYLLFWLLAGGGGGVLCSIE